MKKGEIYEGIVENMDFPNKGILHIGEEKVVGKERAPGADRRDRDLQAAQRKMRGDSLRS